MPTTLNTFHHNFSSAFTAHADNKSHPMLENSIEVTAGDRNQEERHQIDKEIRTLQGQILELRSSRNRLAPVAQLSNKILTKIFLIARDGHQPPRGRMVLALTWICRDWREAAIKFSPLWSIVDSSNPDWVDAFSRRSEKTPLWINIPEMRPQHFSAGSIPLLLANHSRIASLFLGAPGRGLICGRDWETPAPLLQQLTLRNFTLSTNLFSGILPSLRSLSLTACGADWTKLPLCPDLVDLHIIMPALRVSAETILLILQSLPKLQFFESGQGLSLEAGIEPNNQHRVLLRSLLALYFIGESTHSIIALFSRIKISPSTNIQLRGILAESPDGPSDMILAVQGSRLDPMWHIDDVWIKFENPFFISITETDSRQSCRIQISFQLLPPLVNEFSQQHLMEILHSLHLASLRVLGIRGQSVAYMPELWRHTLGSLPSLQSLTVSGHFSRHLLMHLKEEADRLAASELTAPGATQGRLTFRTLGALTLGDLHHPAPNYDDIARLRWVLGQRKIYLERLPRLVLGVVDPLPDNIVASFGHVVHEVFQQIMPPPPPLVQGNNRVEGN